MQVQKSVKSWIQNFMREKVSAFNDGTSVFDLYSGFMFYTALIGGSILMVIGAILDSFIVYAIVYTITLSKLVSLSVSITFCFLIQVFLSSSVVLTSVTLLRGKFKSKGYRTLTTTTALLVVISLLSTLYLSWQSQSLVRVVKTPPTPLVHNASFWKEKQDVKEKSAALLRMTKAYSKGEYKRVPWKSLTLVVAVFAYIVNPLDVIPDILPVAGFADDFSLLLWLVQNLGVEIEEFMIWEKS
jgi:uncharacterized membrane protein YkvA (DUF1232 family)